MKTRILIIVLFISFTGFSQEKTTVASYDNTPLNVVLNDIESKFD